MHRMLHAAIPRLTRGEWRTHEARCTFAACTRRGGPVEACDATARGSSAARCGLDGGLTQVRLPAIQYCCGPPPVRTGFLARGRRVRSVSSRLAKPELVARSASPAYWGTFGTPGRVRRAPGTTPEASVLLLGPSQAWR